MALAKQAASAAAREGQPPKLTDLLTEPSWKAVMANHMRTTSFTNLQSFLDGEWGKGTAVFPPQDSIFRCAVLGLNSHIQCSMSQYALLVFRNT